MTGGDTRLSVVIAHVDPGISVVPAVEAVRRSCRNVTTEIIVVQTSDCPNEALGGTSRAMRVPSGLVPQLWAHGLQASIGDYVAFTLANNQVADEWASAVVRALEDGAGGVAGPIACGPTVNLVNRAIYYLRYTGFMPGRIGDAAVPGEIPGDNAAYPRAVLMRHRAALTDGFWEVVFHRCLRADGGSLWTRRDAAARFDGGVTLTNALRHRFAHGRHFGAWRAGEGERGRLAAVAAAPLVPSLLLVRAGRRVWTSSQDRLPFVMAAPVFLLIASAWALGEAVGAMVGSGLCAVPGPVACEPHGPAAS